MTQGGAGQFLLLGLPGERLKQIGRQGDADGVDGVVAMIMAAGRAMLYKPKVSVYETRGLRTL